MNRIRTTGRTTTSVQPLLPSVILPTDASKLADLDGWIHRFEIRSGSSSKLYVIAQHLEKRHWGCSCPGWRNRRDCKHLRELGLPSAERPYEARVIWAQGSFDSSLQTAKADQPLLESQAPPATKQAPRARVIVSEDDV